MEKVYLLACLDACPLAESVRELCQAMGEFMTITKQDILEGLKMDRPVDSHWQPPVTIFSRVLGPPTEGQEKTPIAIGIPQQDGMPRLWAEPPHSFQLNHLPAYQELPPYQHFHPPEHWW